MAIDYDDAIRKVDAEIARLNAEQTARRKALRKLNPTIAQAQALLEACESELQGMKSEEGERHE